MVSTCTGKGVFYNMDKFSSSFYIGRSTEISAGGAKGCLDRRFRAPPAYTTQLLTLHQHRANNKV